MPRPLQKYDIDSCFNKGEVLQISKNLLKEKSSYTYYLNQISPVCKKGAWE